MTPSILPSKKSTAKKHVIAMDVGTTTMRACLFDGKCQLVAVAEEPVCFRCFNLPLGSTFFFVVSFCQNLGVV